MGNFRRTLIAIYLVLGVVLVLIFYPLYLVGGKKKAFAHGRAFFGSNYFIPDRELGWRLRPSVDVRSKKNGTLFKTDAFGFRNSEAVLPPRGQAILLGDSFAQGYYLSSSETIAQQLSSRTGGYVYNFAVGGYSIDQQFVVGQQALKHFKSDYVVLLFSLYDLPFLGKENAWGLKKPRFAEEKGKVRWDHYEPAIGNRDLGPLFLPKEVSAYSVSSFEDGSYLTDRWDLYKLSFWHNLLPWTAKPFSTKPGFRLESIKGKRAYTDAEAFRPELDRAFQFFQKLNELAKSNQSRLVVFLIPEAAQVFSGQEGVFGPQHYFSGTCSKMPELHCVEPHLAYMEAQSKGDLYFRDDGHFSPKGAEFTAEKLALEMK